MRPLTELHPQLPAPPAQDQGTVAQDTFHRLADWLAEVSAEAGNAKPEPEARPPTRAKGSAP